MDVVILFLLVFIGILKDMFMINIPTYNIIG